MTHLPDTTSRHPAEWGLRSTFVGIVANTLLAVTKGIAGVLGNSYALVADAIESTTDIASSFIVWGGLKISTLPPDEGHPYGHGKAEPLAAVVVALILIAAAAAIAIQSVREIVTPHHAPEPFTLIVLVVVVVVKEILFRFVFNVGKAVNSVAVKSDAWHHRSDAITSAAVFIGISVALIGGAGYESADDWSALFAASVIVFNAARILSSAINEVMDAAPSTEIHDSIREVAQRVEGVLALEKFLVRKMGFSYYVDLHVTVDGGLSVRHGHEIARAVKRAVLRTHPTVAEVLVHVEPSDLVHE
ncbi:MAG: cation transporter [Ignavibacteriae bacterium]|nr:cation transporter [Ignavibacteriota bacterium]